MDKRISLAMYSKLSKNPMKSIMALNHIEMRNLLVAAINELNQYALAEHGKEFNNPEFNRILEVFDKILLMGENNMDKRISLAMYSKLSKNPIKNTMALNHIELYNSLVEAINELNQYALAEHGEEFNNPEFNRILEVFDKILLMGEK
jgi:hypothetical protein